MTSPAALVKRPSNPLTPPSPPSKRICRSPTRSPPPKNPLPSIQSIIHLPEDVVWSLRKQELRDFFIALQSYALNPYPLVTPVPLQTIPIPQPTNLPPLLRLPLEIRSQIYTHLLPPPTSPPIRGPHPRQLHANIQLTQSFPPALLLLNRQIRSEALPLLYGAPTQIVYITIDYNAWVHKTRRGNIVLSPSLTAAIKHLHVAIHLGSEKRNNKPNEAEAGVRMSEVKKGIKKLRKWLAAADIQSMILSWQEPPQTYTWEQKKEVLDGLKGMRAVSVEAGEINWGLNWNKGRRFRFEVEYFKELERKGQE